MNEIYIGIWITLESNMIIRIEIKVMIKESKIMMIGIKIMRAVRVKMKIRIKRVLRGRE